MKVMMGYNEFYNKGENIFDIRVFDTVLKYLS